MDKTGRTSARLPFNCSDQANPTWHQRAELCAELVGSLEFSSKKELALADIGCGDQKLREALRQRGLNCHYEGFDLMPQSSDVTRFDLQSDVLPRTYDVVVLLGVIEYLEQVEKVLAALVLKAPWLVLSHVIRQGDYYTTERRVELGWRNHFTETEIGRVLENNGLAVVRRELTSDNRTLLIVCRSMRFAKAPVLARA